MIKQRSKFLLVKCPKCGNEQVVFGSAASEVKCLVCENVLVKPASKKAKVLASVLKVLEWFVLKRKEWPSRGDLVIVKIKRIMDYGAIGSLEEYNNKESFTHRSKISNSWVKNIRSFLSEGQLKVGKVLYVDIRKGTIDVSFRDVSSQQEKRKNEDWKREKKADKIFEKIAVDLKIPLKKAYEEAGFILEDEFGDLFSAFESASIYGEEAFKGLKIPDKWKEAIIDFAKKNITVQKVVIKGYLNLVSYDEKGVEVIKKFLEKYGKEEGVLIEYVSAPRYSIKVEAIDYVTAEKLLKKIVSSMEKEAKKKKIEFSFERIKN